MPKELPVLEVDAGEITELDLELIDDSDPKNPVPTDLTGATVYFMAKTKLSDLDADAEYAEVVTEHTDPENGLTAISLDLSGESADVFAKGRALIAEIFLRDSQGKLEKLATYTLAIGPSVQREFAE